MTTSLPLAIRAFNERLRFHYWGPKPVGRFDTLLVDLADWKLSLTSRTPCLWIHTSELLNLPVVDLADEILDVVRQQAWQNETILVLVESLASDLRRHLSGSFTQFIVLDNKQQKDIFEAPSPTRVALDTIVNQIPRSRLAPYETSRPVTGSRFFGREYYIRKIHGNPKNNFLIIGIRRIGKSSLLREIERRLDESDPPQSDQCRRLYVDCSVIASAEEFYREILLRLNPRNLKQLLGRSSQSLRFQSQMFEQLADLHGGPITFLLDEIDYLLEHLRTDFSLFDVLRRASLQQGVARFIMAGFRQARRAINDRNTPFFNFGEPLTLEALDRQEVKTMVELPMEQLRVKLEGRDEIVQRIYRETAGLPNLVQFYCQTLLEQLDRQGTNTITVENLKSVYENAVFRDFIIQTFMTNSLALERAIVFAMVGASKAESNTSFSLKEIDNELTRRSLMIDFRQLDEACRNLVTAGILQKQGRQFSFSIPLFARMLDENYPVGFVFDKARRELANVEAVR